MQALLFEINSERFYFFKGTSYSVAEQVRSIGFKKQPASSHLDSHLEIYTHSDFPDIQFKIVTIKQRTRVNRNPNIIGFINSKLKGKKPMYSTV
jgi:hypothetical protein